MGKEVLQLVIQRVLTRVKVQRVRQRFPVYRNITRIVVEGNKLPEFSDVALPVTNADLAVINVALLAALELRVMDAAGGMFLIPTDGVNIVVYNAAGSPVDVLLVNT